MKERERERMDLVHQYLAGGMKDYNCFSVCLIHAIHQQTEHSSNIFTV